MDHGKKIKHIVLRHRNELAVGFFVVALPLVVLGASLGTHTLEHKIWVGERSAAAERHFKQEMASALDRTRAALSDDAIREAIITDNASGSADIIRELAQKYNLSALSAVNGEGVVLARLASQRRGDFVFQTSSWGRAAAQGEETVQVGPGRGGYALVMIAAVPLMQDGVVRGAMTGGHILDNAYATKFKQNWLRSGEHIAFYSKEEGVSGVSFQDPGIERLFETYFSRGSDAIQQTESALIAGHFAIGDRLFHVSSLKLYDSSGYVGGMLVLTPVRTWIPYVVAGLFASSGALFFAARLLRRRHRRRDVVGFLVTILLVAGGTAMYGQLVSRRLYPVIVPAETIYNSTIRLMPEADIFSLGEQRVALQIETGGEGINTARAGLIYDPAAVRVVDIVTDNSFCGEQLFLEKSIDNEKGVVAVACVTPSGFFSDRATLAELILQPLRPGNFTLQFDNGTSVLAHDGLGTDVLRMATGGSYQVIGSTLAGSGEMLPLFSYSHPNSTRWYNQRSVHIDWPRLGYEQFAYEFDQVPDTVPDGLHRTSHASIDLVAEENGVYYFHLLPLLGKAAEISHFKIMIDSTQPGIPEIRSSATNIPAGEVVRLTFADRGDDLSGVQKNFYIRFDGTLFPVGPELNIPFLTAGTHTISLRVFDNAGNFSDAKLDIIVQ